MPLLNRSVLTIPAASTISTIKNLRATEIPLALEVAALDGTLTPQATYEDTFLTILVDNQAVTISGVGYHVLPATTYVSVRQLRFQSSAPQSAARTLVLITGEI
jgi:hypothetical protein